MRYDRGKGWRDPGLSIDMSGDWRTQLAIADYGVGYPDWRAAVVISARGAAPPSASPTARPALSALRRSMPKRGTGTAAFNFLRPGMIIAVKERADITACARARDLRRLVARKSHRARARHAGRLRRARRLVLNRATQALRQPGRPSSRSSIRPRSTTA
jgi:penicillin-binding protein 1A